MKKYWNWTVRNLKFLGGMLIAISFIINWQYVNKIEGKINLISSHISDHQYLDLSSQLQFLKYDHQGYPQTDSAWIKLGKRTFKPLSYMLDSVSVDHSEAIKVVNQLDFILHNSVNDLNSYSDYHNQVIKYDGKYGKKMMQTKKQLELKLKTTSNTFNYIYLIGFIMMVCGEFIPKKERDK